MNKQMMSDKRCYRRKAADQICHWLLATGCDVHTSWVRNTPLLAVSGPLPPELRARACWSRETGRDGQPTELALVRLGGCLLHWRPTRTPAAS